MRPKTARKVACSIRSCSRSVKVALSNAHVVCLLPLTNRNADSIASSVLTKCESGKAKSPQGQTPCDQWPPIWFIVMADLLNNYSFRHHQVFCIAHWSGGYMYEQPSRINWSIWLNASQRSRDCVWVNRSVREVKCKPLWEILRIGYCAIKRTNPFTHK